MFLFLDLNQYNAVYLGTERHIAGLRVLGGSPRKVIGFEAIYDLYKAEWRNLIRYDDCGETRSIIGMGDLEIAAAPAHWLEEVPMYDRSLSYHQRFGDKNGNHPPNMEAFEQVLRLGGIHWRRLSLDGLIIHREYVHLDTDSTFDFHGTIYDYDAWEALWTWAKQKGVK